MDQDAAAKELEDRQNKSDQDLQNALNKIFKKHVTELTSEDKEFLYARRDVIGRDKRTEYKAVFAKVEAEHKEKLEREAEVAGEPVPVEDNPSVPEDPMSDDEDEEDEEEVG